MNLFLEILKQVVVLIGHVVWPAVLLVLVHMFRGQLSEIVSAIRRRIADPKSDVLIGRQGIEIKTSVEATQAKVEAIELDQEQMRDLVFRSMEIGVPAGDTAARADAQEIDEDLRELANEYLVVKEPDWSKRVRIKNRLVNRMTNVVLTRNVSRVALAASNNEGLIAALAGTVLSYPHPGDIDLLLQVAPKLSKMHVKYRVIVALTKLFEQGLVPDNLRDESLAMLDRFEVKADSSLSGRIARTRSLIRSLPEQRP